jgi:hypothetical protein
MEKFCSQWSVAPIFAFTDADHWRPGIGDPTVMGWITVFAYIFGAMLCWRAAMKSMIASKLRRFWFGLGILLFALGLNKQLDLQTAFTFIGKDFAKTTGWYENRRIVQAVFIGIIGLCGIGATVALAWYFRPEWGRLWPALFGVGFLITFIVIRAASFHHVDLFLQSGPLGLRMNWILELGGIAAIAIPASRAARRNAQTGFVWITGGNALGPSVSAQRYGSTTRNR